ncbi:MAG: PaaI family thioesterase [Bryobacteraceae bacterium]|nr:PaaI family thioesterase [Bryobacteraceae bacterium]
MAESALVSSRPAAVQSRSLCVVCGADHPHGLRLRFDVSPSGGAEADWTPASEWEGFAGIIHGGIVSTVLDEAMSKAVAATSSLAVTGELRVRYRAHVEPGSTYRIRGWINERKKRLLRTEATLTTPSGEERAHAWATFVEVPKLRDDAAPAEDPSRRPA